MVPLRVMILEDDEDIVDLIRAMFEPSMECCVAHNGLEGLQLIDIARPDFAICDIMMPVMDGFEFIKRVHQMPSHANLPVVFLSALNSPDKIKDGYAQGAALYLTKPIDPARLKRNIEMFIADHHIEPKARRYAIEEIHRLTIAPGALAADDPSASAAPPQAKPAEPEPPAAAEAPAAPDFPPALGNAFPPPQPLLQPKPSVNRAMSNLERYAKAMTRDIDSARPRLLVVDDDLDVCALLREGLSAQYDVIDTHDGITAIDFAARYKPDLFIIDGMLPRMTGYQLAVMLKKNREFFRSPMVFISGKATQRDQQYVQKLGITNFLAKPFTIEAVKKVLAELTQTPGFTIRTDRLPFNQISLEQFQHFETNRPRQASSLEQMERKGLEDALRKQLS